MDRKILKGVEAQIVIWTFYDQVEQEFALFIHCPIAKRSGVAKWVNMLQDITRIFLAYVKADSNPWSYPESWFLWRLIYCRLPKKLLKIERLVYEKDTWIVSKKVSRNHLVGIYKICDVVVTIILHTNINFNKSWK